nr:MAG: polyprotein [Posavirus sp.]
MYYYLFDQFQMSDNNTSVSSSCDSLKQSPADVMSIVSSSTENVVQNLGSSLCDILTHTKTSVMKRSYVPGSSLLSGGETPSSFCKFLSSATPSSVPRSYSHLYAALCANPLYVTNYIPVCKLSEAYVEYLQLISDVQKNLRYFPGPLPERHTVMLRRPLRNPSDAAAELESNYLKRNSSLSASVTPIMRAIESDWLPFGDSVKVISSTMLDWEVEPPISRSGLNKLDPKLFWLLARTQIINLLGIDTDSPAMDNHVAQVMIRTNPLRAIALEKSLEVIIRNATIIPVLQERPLLELIELVLHTFETGEVLYLSQDEFITLNCFIIQPEDSTDPFISSIFEGLFSLMKREAYIPDDAIEFEVTEETSTMINLDNQSPEQLQKLKEQLEKKLDPDSDKANIEKQGWWSKLWTKVKSFFSRNTTDKIADVASDTVLATIKATLSKIWTGCMNGLFALYNFLADNAEMIAWVFIALTATYLISYLFYTSSDYDSTFCRSLFSPVQRILHFKTSAIRPESMDPIPALVTTLSTPFVVAASTTYHSNPVTILRDVATCITAAEKSSNTFISAIQALPGALRRVFTKWFDPEHYLTKSESMALEHTISTLAQYLSSPSICQTTEFITFFDEVFQRINPLVRRTTLSRQTAALWNKVTAFHSASFIKAKAGTFRFEPYYIHVVGDPGSGKSLLAPKLALETASIIIDNPTVCATDLDLTNYGGQDIIFVDELATINPTPDQMNNFLEMVSCLPFFPDLPSLEAHGTGGQKGTPMNALMVVTSGNYTHINMNSEMIEHAYNRRISMIVKFCPKHDVKLRPSEWTNADDIASIVDRDLDIYFGTPDYDGNVTFRRASRWVDLITELRMDLENKYQVHATMKHALGYHDSREIALANIDEIRSDIQDSLDELSSYMTENLEDEIDVPELPDPKDIRIEAANLWDILYEALTTKKGALNYLDSFGVDTSTAARNIKSLLKNVQWTHNVHPKYLFAVEMAFELLARNPTVFTDPAWTECYKYLSLTDDGFSNSVMRAILLKDPKGVKSSLAPLITDKYTSNQSITQYLRDHRLTWAEEPKYETQICFSDWGDMLGCATADFGISRFVHIFGPETTEFALSRATIFPDDTDLARAYKTWYDENHLAVPQDVLDRIAEADAEEQRQAEAEKQAATLGDPPKVPTMQEVVEEQESSDDMDAFFEEEPPSQPLTQPGIVVTLDQSNSTTSTAVVPTATHVVLTTPSSNDDIHETKTVQPDIASGLANMSNFVPLDGVDNQPSESEDSDFSTASSTDSVRCTYAQVVKGRPQEEVLTEINTLASELYNTYGCPEIELKTLKKLPKPSKPLHMCAPIEVMDGDPVDPTSLTVYLREIQIPDGYWALQKVQASHSVISADCYSTQTTCYAGYKYYVVSTVPTAQGAFYNSAQVMGFTKTLLSLRNVSNTGYRKPILGCMAKYLAPMDFVSTETLNAVLSYMSAQEASQANTLVTMMTTVTPEASDVIYWQEQIKAFVRGSAEQCIKECDLARPVHLSLRNIGGSTHVIAKATLAAGKFISLGLEKEAPRDLSLIVKRLYSALKSQIAPEQFSKYLVADKTMIIANEDYLSFMANSAIKDSRICVGEDTTTWGPMMKFKAGLLVNEHTARALSPKNRIDQINRSAVRSLMRQCPSLVVQIMLEALPHYDFDYDPLPIMGDADRNIVDCFWEARYDHFLKSLVHKFGLSATENILKTANQKKWKESDLPTLLPSYETITTCALDFGGAMVSYLNIDYPPDTVEGNHSDLFKKASKLHYDKDDDMSSFYQYAKSPKKKDMYIVNWVAIVPYLEEGSEEIEYEHIIVSSFGFYFLKMFPCLQLGTRTYYFQSSFLVPDHQSAKWQDLTNAQKILNEAGAMFANNGLASRPTVSATNLISKLTGGKVGSWNLEMYLRCLSKTQTFADYISEPVSCATMLRHNYYAPENRTQVTPLRPSVVSTAVGADVPYDPDLTRQLTDALQVTRLTGKSKHLISGATLNDMVTTNSLMNIARSGLKLSNTLEIRDGFKKDKKKTYASIVKSVSTVMPDLKAELAFQSYMTRPKKVLEQLKEKKTSKYPDALERAIATKELHSSLYDKFLYGFKIFSIMTIACSLVWSLTIWLRKRPIRAETPIAPHGVDMLMEQDPRISYPSLQILEPSRMIVRFYSGCLAFYAIQFAMDLFVMNHHVYRTVKDSFNSSSNWFFSHSFYGRKADAVTIDLEHPGFFPVLEDEPNDLIVVKIKIPQCYFVKQQSSAFVSSRDLMRASEDQSHYEVVVAPDARLSRATLQRSGNIVHTSTSNHVVYYSETQRGDCGLPVIISKGLLANQILGIHYASSEAKFDSPQRICFATIVTQEFLKSAYDKYVNSKLRSEGPSLKEVACSDTDINFANSLQEQNVYDLRILPAKSRVHIPDKTAYTETTCCNLAEQIIGPRPEVPAILSTNDPRSGGVDPVKMNILTLNDNPALSCPYDATTLTTVADELTQHLLKFKPLAVEKRILSAEEAVFGIPGVLGPMDLDASPGYDLMKTNPGTHKKDFCDSANHTIDGSLVMEVEAKLARMKDGFPAYEPGENILVMYLKDELARVAKVEEKRTRAIYCNDFVGGILFRRLCGGFLAYYYRNRVRNNSAVATNMLSADVTVYLQHLTNGFSQYKFVMGDYKGFDQHYHPAFQKKAYAVFCKCVRSLCPEVPQTLLTSLLNHDVYPTVVAGPFSFRTVCAHFSGCCFTTIINNIMNELYMRYCFRKLYPRLDFDTNIHCLFYGDDHLLCMDKDMDFPFSYIQATLAKLGQVYTPASKTATSPDYFYNISDLLFCSSKFVPRHGVYVGVLDDKVSKRLFYYTKIGATLEDKVNRFMAYKSIVAGGSREQYLEYLGWCKTLLSSDTDYPPCCFVDTQTSDRERAFYAGTFDLSHPAFVSIDTIRPESQLPTAPLYYPASDQPPTVTMATHIVESNTPDSTQTSSTLVPYAANAHPQDIPLTAANNVKRDSFVVESSMDSGYILKSYAIPNHLLKIAEDKSTQTLGLKSFQLVRFNLDVLFMLVSNVTVCAKLAAVFVPFKKSSEFKVGSKFPLTSYRWLPYIDMYPDNNTLYDFNVPFCCPQTLQHSSELVSDNKYWGTLVVFIVSHISKPNQLGNVPISAMATIDVTVFTGLKAVFNTLPKPVYRPEALEAVSDILKATETAGEVTAEASRAVRETLAKYLWGCDEFTINNKSIAVYQKFPGFANASGVTPTNTLDILPTSRTVQHVLLTDPESMWVNKILEIPFYVKTFAWNAEQARDTVLLEVPLASVFSTVGSAVPLNVVLLNLCYLYHVDFEFTVEVIKTPYHNGALRMTVSYDGKPDQAQLSSYTGSAFVVDKETIFKFSVPYNSTLEYLRSVDTFPPDTRWDDPRYCMGWFTISVETPLKLTALVSTEIECILHVGFSHFYGVYPRSFEPFTSDSSYIRFESQLPVEGETGPAQEPTSLDAGHSEQVDNKIELPNPEYKQPARQQATEHANTFKPHNYYTENSGKKFEYSLSSLLAFEKRFKRLPAPAIIPVKDASLPEAYGLWEIDYLSCLTFKDWFASYAGSFELRIVYSGNVIPSVYCLPMPPVEDQNSNFFPSFALVPDLKTQLGSSVTLSTAGAPLPAMDLPTPVGNNIWYVDVTIPFVVQENVAMLHPDTTYATSASHKVYLVAAKSVSLFVYARVADDFAYHYHTLPPLYSVTRAPVGQHFTMGQFVFHG